MLANFSAPILEEATAILQALQDMSMGLGSRLLRQARFVDFFALTGDTSTSAGGLIRGVVDVAQQDFADSPDALREDVMRYSVADSPDADYLHADSGQGYRVGVSGVVGDTDEAPEEIY